MKISLLLNDFLIYIVTEKGDLEVTKKIYEKDLLDFINYYKDLDSNELDISIYDDYLAYLTDCGLKKSTINRKMTTIRNFYYFLNRKGYIRFSIKQLETPKKERRLPKYLTDDEVDRLLDACKDDILDFTMILFDLSTGLRVSELVNLRYDNISFNDRYVKVKGKREKSRIVPFSNECKIAIEKYILTKKLKKNSLVFTNNKNLKISRQSFYQTIRKYAKRANINKIFGPHVLRHTYATRLLNNGIKLKQIQLLLGHNQIETTEIYTHLENKKIRSIYDDAIKR